MRTSYSFLFLLKLLYANFGYVNVFGKGILLRKIPGILLRKIPGILLRKIPCILPEPINIIQAYREKCNNMDGKS